MTRRSSVHSLDHNAMSAAVDGPLLSDITVYCIVVTHNGSPWIEACFNSLLSDLCPVNVIVVDNCSTDSTCNIIREKFRMVRLIALKSNIGFGAANNIGLRTALQSGADYVLLLNQDAKLHPSALATLIGTASKHPEIGILGPLTLDYSGEQIDSAFHNNLMEVAKEMVSDFLLGRRKEVYAVGFLPAAAWLVNSQALRVVGGFDPLFFMYGEDADVCNRMRFHGFKIAFSPLAIAFHWHHGGKLYGIDRFVTLPELVNFFLTGFLIELKRPTGRPYARCISVFRLWFIDVIRAGRSMNGRRCLALILVLAKLVFGIRRIMEHRVRSIRQDGAWLPSASHDQSA